MPASQQKLQEILARENDKKGPMGYRAPALYRDTALDTHATLPVADFGPSIDRMDAIAEHRARAQATRAMYVQPHMMSKQLSQPMPSLSPTLRAGEFRSVFKPAPHQQHACSMATVRRENIKNSEWALIETLEVDVYNKAREQKRQMDASRAAQYRSMLDQQMQMKMGKERAELEVKMREGMEAEAAVAAFKAEEKLKLDMLKDRNLRLKAETMAMVTAAREEKASQLKAKKYEEAEFLRQCQEKLAEEQEMRSAKAAAYKEMQEQMKRDNVQRLQEKSDLARKQREAEDAMTKAAIERAIALDLEREAAAREFAEANQAKMNRALAHPGMQRAAQMQALEEAWLKKSAAEKEAEEERKEQLKREKREKMRVELKQAHEDFLEQRKRQAAELKAEMDALRKSTTAAELAEREYQAQRVAALRKKNMDSRMFLSMQITDKEERAMVEDTGMSERERQLNLKLLNHAVSAVGPTPKQMVVDFL